MAAFVPIVQPKVTSEEVQARRKLAAHVTVGTRPGVNLAPPSNGSSSRSFGTKVSGGARLSGGRG
jgi:hypothetical protein